MSKKLLSIILVLCLILSTMTISGTCETNTATDYYVSSSTGNDSWPGTMSKPWKTLARVSRQTFSAGDTINLKCGDTWTGEELYLKGTGASSTNWITLQSYGTGEKPKIFPGEDFDWSIKIENTDDTDRNCGWKIKDIEVGYAKMGIALIDTRANPAQPLDGLWVENCYLHDFKGYPERVSRITYFSSALRTYSANSVICNVTFKNNTVIRCDIGIHPWNMTNFLVDNCYVDYSSYIGMEFHMDHEGIIQNCRVLNSGVVGRLAGTAGVEFDSFVSNVIMKDTEIAYTVTPNGSPDGCGVDYEGYSSNVTTMNCNIHDNAGRAFLIMATGGDNEKSNIINNTMTNNGINNLEPAFLLLLGNKNNGGTISGNVINRRSGQYLVVLNGSKPSMSFPEGFNCYDNIVNEGCEGSAAELKFRMNAKGWNETYDISSFDWESGGYAGDHASNAKATWRDRVNWVKSGVMSWWSRLFNKTPDADKAYNHYRGGSGADLEIDYEKAYTEDAAIKSSIDTLIDLAKEQAEALQMSSGETSFEMTSDLYSIQNGSTENWQRTIGAHYVWANASVEFENGQFTMEITIHMNDLYNFNRNMADIAPGTSDDINGRFAELGWAKPFYMAGELTRTITWEGSPIPYTGS